MIYGKFATAEELLKGYNELEKSFTQKCQQLAASEKGKAQIAQQLSKFTATSEENLQNDALQTTVVAEHDGTSAEASPSQEVVQSTTVDSAVTVPQNDSGATVVLDGVAQPTQTPTDQQLQQYLEANPQVVSKLLHKSAKAPSVMSGGGNVSMALPSRPKSIKEASMMAKEMFFKR